MMHEEFAERFAERLEGQPAGQGAAATRATELRAAAEMAKRLRR